MSNIIRTCNIVKDITLVYLSDRDQDTDLNSKSKSLKKLASVFSSYGGVLGKIAQTLSLENQQSNVEAIIFDKKIDFRTEPNFRSEIQFNLHEGTKVKLKEELDDWVLVELSNGASGWLELNSIKKID